MSAVILSGTNLIVQTLYHYTSEEGKKGIETTEIIKSSKVEAGDALHGDGVYFTDMNPADYTMSQVAYNNYRRSNAKRKLAYCVIVAMPKDLVKRCPEGN